MVGMHGDLFSEIGKLVVAAHGGQPIDLIDTSEDLAQRYANLGVPADAIARAIARSLGAVGLSLALVDARKEAESSSGDDVVQFVGVGKQPADAPDEVNVLAEQEMSGSVLLPSGVRLAVLS
jgi:hypothetical protein